MPERTKEGELHLQVYCLRRDLRKMQDQLNWVADGEIYWKKMAEDFLMEKEELEIEMNERREMLHESYALTRKWSRKYRDVAAANRQMRLDLVKALGMSIIFPPELKI